MNRLLWSLLDAARRVALALPLAPLLVLASASLLLALPGCTPGIGDKCTLSTDCSVTGTLVCDTSQPSGYCTVLNCTDGSCPNSAVCVMFQSTVPGCAYNDYQSPSRTGRSFCMEHCNKDSDCRQSDGYVCGDPTGPPWNAAILDNTQSQGVCLVPPPNFSTQADAAVTSPQPDAAVCVATAQDAEAIQGTTDAGADAAREGGDAGADSGDAASDAGRDAGDATADSAAEGGGDATDGQSDLLNDGSGDTGSADAPGGG